MVASAAVEIRRLAEPPPAHARAFVGADSSAAEASARANQTHDESAPSETDTASLRVAPYQVAGHSSKGVGLPSLVDDAGHFLKPCPDDRKGAQEVAFYRRVDAALASGADPATSLAGFAPYLPKYHGMFRVDAAGIVAVAGDDPTAAAARTIAAAGESAVFIRLEDVTAGYSKPCVADLKIGLRTYSPVGHDSAYIAKRAAHDQRSGQADVGFKVCGMQTWEMVPVPVRGAGDCSAAEGKFALAKSDAPADGWAQRRRPYEWARNLCDRDAVRAALEEFVGCREGCRVENEASRRADSPSSSGSGDTTFHAADDADPVRGLANLSPSPSSSPSPSPRCRAAEVFGEALTQIEGLRAWMSTQRELHLLGSSVLVVYEGDTSVAEPAGTRVCVIDFCNYVDARGETDDNFGAGLDRLADVMRDIVAANASGSGRG